VKVRLFLLSPARCDGSRARRLLAPDAGFPLAERLRSPEGAPLGEVFTFVSGLYFRGKLTYARRFAVSPEAWEDAAQSRVQVITATDGLVPPDRLVTPAALRAFAGQDISAGNTLFARVLAESAGAVAAAAGPACEAILLGSIATPKYVDVLLEVFGDRLHFPVPFVGRGDMSRGGLLLRHAASGVELEYAPVRGAVRRGRRPPRLEPLAARG